jgi:hypothetical protein
MEELVPMDEPAAIPLLLQYGRQMGRMIMEDRTDRVAMIKPSKARLEIK